MSFDCLPEDVLLQIIRPLELMDKIRLQLVSAKLYALLLSPPPGEGLWGEFDLSGKMSDCVDGLDDDHSTDPGEIYGDSDGFMDPESRR